MCNNYTKNLHLSTINLYICVKNTQNKMKYLHLDPNFIPFGKSIAFEQFTFNGGEPHIRINENVVTNITEVINKKMLATNKMLITSRIRSFNDLGFLLVATDALKRMGIKNISLLLPYFPAARQDRVMIKGEALSVKIYADIINSVDFEEVIILDPHSEVTPALVNNVTVINNHNFVKEALANEDDYLLISPDGGALKKVYQLSKALGGQPVVECSKKRDLQTGQLSGFTVYEEDLKGKTCVIVDDICDGGGTFLGLAKALKAKNAGDLILVVTHGIFSKGLTELNQHFSAIYCTDSFSTMKADGLTQIRIGDGILL